jgi:quercetin dioxygenase-like cupin family protein
MVISEGDVVVIPAGVAHGFSKILDQVTYLSIRVDADQVLPAGYKHPLID